MKIIDLLNASAALQKLYNEHRLPIRYKSRLIQLVKNQVDPALVAHNQALEELRGRVKDIKPDDKRDEEFREQLKPMLDEEVLIQVKPIPYSELERKGIELSAADLDALSWLVEIDENDSD